MKKNAIIGFSLLLLPFVVSAQLDRTYDFLFSARAIIDVLFGVLSALALLVFIWGIVKYIAGAGDEGKAKEGKSIMIYGVLALFVLFSVWGIINFLQGEFTLEGNQPLKPPAVTL